MNRHIRTLLGFEGATPQPGERVICLRNNWFAKHCQIFNGMTGTLLTIGKAKRTRNGPVCAATIQMDGEAEPYEGRISAAQFDEPKTLPYPNDAASGKAVDLFDRGYALTVHKAQGSEARKVILFEQKTRLWEGEMWNRWLYTGITRAQEELCIVGKA